MSYLKELLIFVRFLLQLIGAGTVVGGIGWLVKKRQKRFENMILKVFEDDDDWHGADGILGELYLRATLKGLPAYLMFPPPSVIGWQRLKLQVRAVPYRVRHSFRKLVLLPSRQRIDSTLRALWERGLLNRASFEPKFYRLRH
jgi:hypothetical protein